MCVIGSNRQNVCVLYRKRAERRKKKINIENKEKGTEIETKGNRKILSKRKKEREKDKKGEV